jgi:cholesterol oxidase
LGTQEEHFDAVVVGSGFGGAVTAYRLAEGDRRVLVLERGKGYPPGSFPRSPLGLKNNLWDPSEGLHGMFDLWSFDGLEAVAASGLGGGSLIYANVMIRKDERWFVQEDIDRGGYEYWPVTRADLDPHYDRAEAMLDARPYPYGEPPYDATPKTRAFEAVAKERGLDWFLPKLAVTFAPEPEAAPVPGEPIREARPNIHKRTRQTCRLVGECDVGCNYGAKNTLDYNYLTAAWHAGADIRTRCEVRSFEPREGGGYTIHYVEHSPESEGHRTDTQRLPTRTVTSDRLVLAAGTLGTTYLLLRNRAAFPALSPRLGTRFCGNGDLLTFAVRCTERAGDGRGKPAVIEPGRGPVITSAVRVPDALDGGEGRGFYIEDAGFPEFGTWLLEALDQPSVLARTAPTLIARLVNRVLRRDPDTDLSAELSTMFGDCGLAAGVLPLLGMGRDIPDGRMTLEDGRLQVDWRKHGASAQYFDRLRAESREIANHLGGTFNDNVLWYLNRVITVHALGGCPMGRTESEGVVDPNGRVFNYPGLHVADGSVMPGPVGPNPSLTIAALADRFADALLEEGPSVPTSMPSPAPLAEGAGRDAHAPAPTGRATSVSFTEEMKGFVRFGEDDFDRGYRAGRQSRTGLMFHLTITADDLDRFIADPEHVARAEGHVRADALGGELPVERGDFNLLVDLERDPRHKRMLYRLHFADASGHPLTLSGFKVVEDDPGIDSVWSDTSTLFTRILAGHVEAVQEGEAELIASGILHIHPLDFARQLTTFRTDPPDRLDAVARFGSLFAGDLWEVYGPAAESGEAGER